MATRDHFEYHVWEDDKGRLVILESLPLSMYMRKYAYPGQRCPLGTEWENISTNVVKKDFMNREEIPGDSCIVQDVDIPFEM